MSHAFLPHAALGEEGRVELEDDRFEKTAIDVGVQVRLFAHELREPTETRLAVAREDCILSKAPPDLFRLRLGQPQLSVLANSTHTKTCYN